MKPALALKWGRGELLELLLILAGMCSLKKISDGFLYNRKCFEKVL